MNNAQLNELKKKYVANGAARAGDAHVPNRYALGGVRPSR
jgi:hypothetical protein